MKEPSLREILDELRDLRALLTNHRHLDNDDLVDCDYIATRTGLKPRTIRDGKAGTDSIPRVLLSGSGKRAPVRFRRIDADRWIRNLAIDRPIKERALRLIHRKPRRRKAA